MSDNRVLDLTALEPAFAALIALVREKEADNAALRATLDAVRRAVDENRWTEAKRLLEEK